MKKIIIVVAALAMGLTFAKAQSPYKTSLTNSAESSVELSINAHEIIIEGGTGNEIVIESSGQKVTGPPAPPQPPKDEDVPDRAKGLKPLSPSGNDNTGLGISVEKVEGYVKISSGINVASEKVKVILPNKVNLIIQDMPHMGHTQNSYNISKMEGEITVTSMNSNFKLADLSGPLVLNTTNGNVEAVYSSIKSNKPISIVTVNGFVDLTIPSTTKAEMEMQSVNGKAYTDFDIKSTDDTEGMTFVNMQLFHLNGTINGGGGLKISLSSINGDIYLRKK